MRINRNVPYSIKAQADGKMIVVFPSDGPTDECPCHYRLAVEPYAGLEADLRQDYYEWKQRAKEATERCIIEAAQEDAMEGGAKDEYKGQANACGQ